MAKTDEKFDKALESYVEGCNKIFNDYVTHMGYEEICAKDCISIGGGRKYIKLIRKDRSQESVHAFVDTTNGDVLKPAGWSAPAKHARGNIFDEHNGLSKMGPHGPAYLK